MLGYFSLGGSYLKPKEAVIVSNGYTHNGRGAVVLSMTKAPSNSFLEKEAVETESKAIVELPAPVRSEADHRARSGAAAVEDVLSQAAESRSQNAFSLETDCPRLRRIFG